MRPIDRALEQVPKVFQSVRMDIAANVGFRVIDNFVDVALLFQSLILGSGALCCLRRGPEALLMRARRFLWYSKPYIAFG